MIRIKLTFVTLALIQACHALAQLDIAALHSQRLPAAYSPSSTNTLVGSRLSRRKAASSRNPLRATEDDSDVVEGVGGMRTSPLLLVREVRQRDRMAVVLEDDRIGSGRAGARVGRQDRMQMRQLRWSPWSCLPRWTHEG